MKLSTFGLVAVTATLMSMANVGNALPTRLERRDPVTKIIKYVLYGDNGNNDKSEHTAPKEPSHDYHQQTSSNPSQDEREMLCLVNKERRRNNLRPLAIHPAMTRAAHEHSEYQSRVRSMTHNDPQNGQLGSRLKNIGFNFASAAENIANAPGNSVKSVFDMWMNDPPHYENIMDPNSMYMGLACVDGFWTQDFGSASDASDAPQYESHDYC